MLNSLQYGRYSFIFTPYLCIQPTLQSPSNICSSTSVNFHLPVHPLLVHKIILTISTNNITSAILSLTLFCVQPSQQPTPKIPFTQWQLFIQPFIQFRMREGTRELGNLVSTLLISTFFLKVWTVITGLTISDYLLLRIRKFVYCRCGKPSNLPSLIPTTHCHYFHTPLIPPQELAFPWKLVALHNFHLQFSILLY